MQGQVSIHDFMQHLEQEGLVIVKKEDLVQLAAAPVRTLEQLRIDAFRKKAISFSEILRLKVLNVTTRQGLQGLIDRGVIKEHECYKTAGGKRMVSTCAIKRIAGYE